MIKFITQDKGDIRMEKNKPIISKLTELNPAEIKELLNIINYKIFEYKED
jgi:hypothetical protein